MGAVIRFPGERRTARDSMSADEWIGGATIIILPVVRVERLAEAQADGRAPDTDDTSGRKRRRRE
jgi:hypothetical protein